jgi:hypothetical protein
MGATGVVDMAVADMAAVMAGVEAVVATVGVEAEVMAGAGDTAGVAATDGAEAM